MIKATKRTPYWQRNYVKTPICRLLTRLKTNQATCYPTPQRLPIPSLTFINTSITNRTSPAIPPPLTSPDACNNTWSIVGSPISNPLT